MYVKTIDIGSIAGIDEAIDFLETEMSKDALLKKAEKIATVLVEKGKVVAESEYPEDVKVEADGGTLTASHPEIAFIEFGAGITTDGSGEFAAHAPFNVEEGSYSVAKSPPGMYAKTGFRYWIHDGKRMNAIVPHPGMEMARQHITEDGVIDEAVKEVLSLD